MVLDVTKKKNDRIGWQKIGFNILDDVKTYWKLIQVEKYIDEMRFTYNKKTVCSSERRKKLHKTHLIDK